MAHTLFVAKTSVFLTLEIQIFWKMQVESCNLHEFGVFWRVKEEGSAAVL
jgi:hypothetical protein